MRRIAAAVSTALLLAAWFAAFAGCSKKPEPPPPSREAAAPPPAPPAREPVPEGPTVTLSGTVHFEGSAPERKTIKMSADLNCAKMHTEPVLTEDVIVHDGKLQNVFVYVKTGLEGRTFPIPSTAAVLDQNGCMYRPRVIGVMANQKIRILNSDPTLHNVHALPKKGEFNVGMPRAGMEIERSFSEPEVMVHFKCDVHPWMSAWVGVQSHPFFAVSGADGKWSIAGLPVGTYTIEAWHEKLGTATESVSVGEQPAVTVDFTFRAATGT
jgi:hypothetical protein